MAQDICAALVSTAVEKESRDNVSAIVVLLDPDALDAGPPEFSGAGSDPAPAVVESFDGFGDGEHEFEAPDGFAAMSAADAAHCERFWDAVGTSVAAHAAGVRLRMVGWLERCAVDL